jgi:hypothetical protein
MSSGDSSAPRLSTAPSASGAGAARSEVIQSAFETLGRVFSPDDEDDEIKDNLYLARAVVEMFHFRLGDSDIEKRIRNIYEFNSYATSGSNREQELVNLVKSMANLEVPWEDLFDHGTLLRSFDAEHNCHHILSL